MKDNKEFCQFGNPVETIYKFDNLDDLPEELLELVVRIISTPPVNQFPKLSHFQESPTKRVPFTYVEPYQFAP